MKIRMGFVSNSSTSSFLIYGTDDISSEEYDLISDKYYKEIDYYCPYGNHYYIGYSWDSIKDDETGKQFKDRVESKIKELLGRDNMSFGTYEEAWQDGW